MPVFITNTIDGVAAVQDNTWEDVQVEAAKHHRSAIEVRKYDEIAEISEQQRKWLHCKAGPIRELMREGWSFRDAKEYVKVEYGRQWFVVELTDKNCNEVDGVFRWECKRVACRKLIHPVDVLYYVDNYENAPVKRQCPHCGNVQLKPIAIKSIMAVSVKNTNFWFAEIFDHMPKILPPDPDWELNEQKDRKKEVAL